MQENAKNLWPERQTISRMRRSDTPARIRPELPPRSRSGPEPASETSTAREEFIGRIMGILLFSRTGYLSVSWGLQCIPSNSNSD